jgi:DNA repair exonuclease SbcCD ATPase subunit
MLISSLSLHNFMSHDDSRIDLPKTGLVLVTGPNGAGKSALMEAVPSL